MVLRFICSRCISPLEFSILLFFSFKTIANSNRQIRLPCADAGNPIWLFPFFHFSMTTFLQSGVSPNFWFGLCHLCLFCCCWNYVSTLFPSSACCPLVHGHPFSLSFGWYRISKSACYGISCVILGTFSWYFFVHFLCLLCFGFCYLIIVLVWCHSVYFCLWVVFVCIEHF